MKKLYCLFILLTLLFIMGCGKKAIEGPVQEPKDTAVTQTETSITEVDQLGELEDKEVESDLDNLDDFVNQI